MVQPTLQNMKQQVGVDQGSGLTHQIEDEMIRREVANRNDDTPEEKLKYARLQTEGYQDDGYRDSEEEVSSL